MTIEPRATGWRAPWPDRRDRLRLWRLWRRWRRHPERGPATLPRAWRHEVRLAFWWTLLASGLEQPLLTVAALLAVPGWLLLVLHRAGWSR